MNPKELKKKLFLAKNKQGMAAWNIAAVKGNVEALENSKELLVE